MLVRQFLTDQSVPWLTNIFILAQLRKREKSSSATYLEGEGILK